MMKQEMLCTCDICGTSEKAQTLGTPYRDVEYIPPKGWGESKVNRGVHLCPKCWAAFEKRVAE